MITEAPTTEAVAELRASFMPIACKCASALPGKDDGLRIRQNAGKVTAGGTATHEVCQIIVATGDRPEDLKPYAAAHDCDEDHLGRASWYALKFWRDHGGLFPHAQTEQKLKAEFGPYTLTGHTDVLSLLSAEEGAVLDWKAGYRTEVDVVDQVKAYAYLAAKKYNLSKVSATVVWLLDKTYQKWEWTVGDLAQWMLDVLERWDTWTGNTYETGEHCHYCPRRFTCPGQQALVKATLRDLGELAVMKEGELAPASLAQIYPAVQNVERLCKTYRDLVRQAVAEAGEPLPIDAETELKLVDSVREGIDPVVGWPIMASRFEDTNELAAAVKVSKTKLLKLVSDKAERGQKGKVKDALMDELRAAEAITQTEITSLRAVRRASA